MLNVTFSLPEETVKRVRRAAAMNGKRRKGAISELVDAAINEHLDSVESRGAGEEFRALKKDKVVARAPTLRELAGTLERLNLNPRDVVIESSAPLPTLVRTGLRGHTG